MFVYSYSLFLRILLTVVYVYGNSPTLLLYYPAILPADASVIPHIPNGNVHSTVTVVASMATDFLLNNYQLITALLR